jgi:D-alanyl-D-alanine carboxypeptidase
MVRVRSGQLLLDKPAFAVVGALLLAGALALWPVPAAAGARHAALVIDVNTGKVLESAAADEPRYPASLTKMMTLYMAFELIDKGRLSYDSKIKISQEAANAAPSKLDLDPGEQIRVIDAVKALVTKSANDVAVALAEHIAGTEANFARLMTSKARQIGMSRTTFKNASGLPDSEQTTTARDMVTLALRLIDDFPEHFKHFSTRSFTYNGSVHRNHNTLMLGLRGSDGIKTGYTRASGFNLVSSVRQDGKHVVGAVFGGSSAASRNAEMRVLLTRALAKASTARTRKPMLVADPKPAVRPKPAAVADAAQRPAQPAAPAATAPKPDRAPAPPPVATEVPRPAPETVLEPRIEVAQVRRVMVAPRERRPAAPEQGAASPLGLGTIEPPRPSEPPIAAPERPSPSPDDSRFAFAAGALSPSAVEARVGQPVGRPPSTLDDQVALLLARDSAPSAPPPQPVALAAAAGPQPSRRLDSPARADVSRSAPAPVLRKEATASGFLIQVGAYASRDEAERQVAFVRTKAAGLLQGHDAETPRIEKGNRAFYRARFAGFSSGEAAQACLELRRRALDCFVMKAE